MKPSIVPSACTSPTFPGSTLAGRCTRTTVATTNGASCRGELLRPPRERVSDHCGGSGRPCIAAQTRAGVQGMSM